MPRAVPPAPPRPVLPRLHTTSQTASSLRTIPSSVPLVPARQHVVARTPALPGTCLWPNSASASLGLGASCGVLRECFGHAAAQACQCERPAACRGGGEPGKETAARKGGESTARQK